MPYSRRPYRARRRAPYRRRPNNGLATRPRMMPKGLAFKRMNQVSTKVFWFKYNGQIAIPPIVETRFLPFLTQDLVDPAVNVQQFQSVFNLYDQYKVLGMKVNLFPSNVGTEPGSLITAATNRGDTIIWSDQRVDPTVPAPLFISEVIQNASARMIDSRRKYSRSLYRPKGKPSWGSTIDYNSADPSPDLWNGSINVLINNASSNRTLWYYTVTFKVVVRGRRQG